LLIINVQPSIRSVSSDITQRIAHVNRDTTELSIVFCESEETKRHAIYLYFLLTKQNEHAVYFYHEYCHTLDQNFLICLVTPVIRITRCLHWSIAMFNSVYSFRFHHLKFDIPYTNIIVELTSPWSYIVSWGSCLIYLLLIVSIFPRLKSRLSPTVSKLHYALLFVYSLVAFLAVLIYIILTDEINNWSRFICAPLPGWLRLISISFTLSKIWEWFDTAILQSKGQSLKKIGFLHIYHHATTFLLFLVVMNFPGAEKCGMLLNGFVHTLMYYHFAFRLPKFLRPFITVLQILQLMTVTYVWHNVPSSCSIYSHFPQENYLEYVTPYALVPVYCLFFFKFFFEQYILVPSKSFPKTE
jgi:hypothetical protein